MRSFVNLSKPVLFTFIGLFFLSGLGGCGESLSAGTAGVFVDSSTGEFLKSAFEEAKECTQLHVGNFEDLSITLMPPTFPCRYYEKGCSGEYLEPNHIKVGTHFIWRHEVIHYLLYINTGDPDTHHQSPLFNTCA